MKAVEKHVQRTVSRRKMLTAYDRVALALSGGKDSVSLLHILRRVKTAFPHIDLVAVTIDEGVAGYRAEAIEIARQSCTELDVEHRICSFRELYGHNLDEIAEVARRKGKAFICSYCGILRRKALNVVAREVGATKLVTAHNLDDQVQSMMMNLFRGDVANLVREKSHESKEERLIPRVKPLCEVPEREVALYAFLVGIRFQSKRCCYLESSFRNDIRKFLNAMEGRHAGMKFTVYRSFEKMQLHQWPLGNRVPSSCTVCGEPTTREICMACQILKELNLDAH